MSEVQLGVGDSEHLHTTGAIGNGAGWGRPHTIMEQEGSKLEKETLVTTVDTYILHTTSSTARDN